MGMFDKLKSLGAPKPINCLFVLRDKKTPKDDELARTITDAEKQGLKVVNLINFHTSNPLEKELTQASLNSFRDHVTKVIERATNEVKKFGQVGVLNLIRTQSDNHIDSSLGLLSSTRQIINAIGDRLNNLFLAATTRGRAFRTDRGMRAKNIYDLQTNEINPIIDESANRKEAKAKASGAISNVLGYLANSEDLDNDKTAPLHGKIFVHNAGNPARKNLCDFVRKIACLDTESAK